MSNTPIKDQLENKLADISMVGNKTVSGLYFRNLNRDRAVRVVATRPNPIAATMNIENNNPTIEQIDDNTVGFCLSPRPPLNIQCVDATSSVALEMKVGKKYKIVLNGNTITIDASVTQLREILSQYGLTVDYVIAPREYYCTEYVKGSTVAIALDTVDTNKPLLFTLTTDTGEVIQENINTGSSLFSLGTIGTVFVTRELIAIDGKLVMNFDLTQLTSIMGVNVKLEVKPLTSDFTAVPLDSITVPEGQEIPYADMLDNVTIFNKSAYICLSMENN